MDKQSQQPAPVRELKIERKNLAQHAASRLRDAIIAGDFAPDERLTETSLANGLAVSRGTLRTALASLETEGFVVCKNYRSWQIAPLGRQEIWESYTFRATLESMAARLVAQRVNDSVREELTRLLEDMTQAKTSENRLECDLALHTTIVRQAGHSHLSQIYEQALNRFKWIYALSENIEPERINLHDWHSPLVTAICAGDAVQASQIAHDMIMTSMSDDLAASSAPVEQEIST